MNKIEFTEQLALELLESEIEFAVNLDDAVLWLGYSRKDTLKEKLLKHFEEGIDFIITPANTGNVAIQGVESIRKENIYLTIDTFKELGMLAGTDKGREIRRYFIKCEKELKRRIKEEQQKDLLEFIKEQRETNKRLMQRTQRLDDIDNASKVNKGCSDIIDGEINNNYIGKTYNCKEFLEEKGVDLKHLPTLSRRAAQMIRCGKYGEPNKNKDGQYVYSDSQINYLVVALKTILDI